MCLFNLLQYMIDVIICTVSILCVIIYPYNSLGKNIRLVYLIRYKIAAHDRCSNIYSFYTMHYYIVHDRCSI